MLKKRFLVILLIVFLITLGCVWAEDNTTQALEKKSVEVKTFDDIQNAINKAGENDTIELEGTYTSQGKEIKIDKPITITSKDGATLNANKKSNVFNISNVNVILDNLNIINSKSETASAIYSIGNLTVSNTNFTDNSVHIKNTYYAFNDPEEDIGYSAGAIYSANTLTITNSTFKNNYAVRDAYEHEYFEDYLIDWGGAIYSSGNLMIDTSQFKNDEIRSYGTLRVLNSKFKNSNIICVGNSTITNSSFNKCKTRVISFSQNLNLTGCRFTNNPMEVITDENYEDAPDLLIIRNCIFKNNNLICGDSYDYNTDEEDLNWEYKTIELNNVLTYVYDSTFENNTESAIDVNANLYVFNSKFIKNTNTAIRGVNLTISNSTFIENVGHLGGAIKTGNLSLTDCTFENNREGAIEVYDSATVNANTYANHSYFNNDLEEIGIEGLVSVSVMSEFSTTYKSGKCLAIKVVYTENNHPYDGSIDIRLINGKKTYDYSGWTNSKGVWNFKASNLPVGTYNAIVNYDSPYDLPQRNVTIKISKAKTVVKAPKVTNKKYFKITVKNKASKKGIGKVVLNLKIGKRIYDVKTNKNGVAKFSTKHLKAGKHRVTITTQNPNYKISAKSTITIK